MNFTTGFFEPDLNVYLKIHEDVEQITANKKDTNYKNTDNLYCIFYLINGSARISLGDFSEVIGENTLVVIKPKSRFKFYVGYNQPFRYCLIDIHPSMIKSPQIVDTLNTLANEECIFCLDSKENFYLKAMMQSLVWTVQKRYNRSHIEPRVLSIISEISRISIEFKNVNVEIDSSVAVQVIEYIQRHYTENITYEVLKSKFFISDPTINTIIHNFTGKTLAKFIMDLRLQDAEIMIKNNQSHLSKIAELSGFNNYSTFYRAYKEYFGVSPAQNKKKNSRYWPLSKK